MGGRGSNEKRRNRCTGEQGEQEEQENRGNSYLYTSNDNNIFFWGGGGVGNFGGEASTPQIP